MKSVNPTQIGLHRFGTPLQPRTPAASNTEIVPTNPLPPVTYTRPSTTAGAPRGSNGRLALHSGEQVRGAPEQWLAPEASSATSPWSPPV